MSQQPKGITAPEEVRTALAALIERVGEPAAAAQMDLSRHTLARIVGCLPVHRSTIGQVRMRLGLNHAAGTSS